MKTTVPGFWFLVSGFSKTRNQEPGTRNCRRRSGFTLVEVLVAMSVLLLLGVMMVAILRSSLEAWNQAERQRKVYSRARVVFTTLADDLESALTRDPPGMPVTARMFCEPDARPGPGLGRQVLMLTRTFGAGPERIYTFRAGDGLDTVDLPPMDAKKIQPDDEDSDPRNGRVDEEFYNLVDNDGDGHVDEDLMPLGGAAQVVYLHEGRTLKRAVGSPCGPKFADMFKYAQPLADDVLYFGLLFYTPITTTWDESVPRVNSKTYDGRRGFGPDRCWDSTRGVIRGFSFYAGPESQDDGEDDVFPELVQVTVVIEPHELRTVRTAAAAVVDENVGVVKVDSTRGFPPPGTDTSYILVDDEWMHYKDLTPKSFVIDRRGARSSTRAVHAIGAAVRCGFTFTQVFRLPAHRSEDAAPGGARP